MSAAVNPESASMRHHTGVANGIKLHYVTAGSGQPVLLWHGFLGTWFSWRKVIPLLAEEYTVIVPDMRGYGDSDRPLSGYDGETLCEDFRALTKQLGTGPMHIVAHDMGAPPALLWAGKGNGEVRSLTYLDEPVLTNECLAPLFQFGPRISKSGGLWWWTFAFATDMPERLIVGREREFLSWFSQNYLAEPDAMDAAALSEYLRTFAGREGVRGAFGVYRALFDTIAQTERLRTGAVTVPVLALGGSASIGDGSYRMMSTVAKHAQGGAMEGCGHFIPEEQPVELVRRIKAFWREGV